MSGSYLLDTNVAIALIKGEPGLADRFGDEDSFYLSVIVMGELYYGAAKSSHPERNTSQAEGVAGKMRAVLPCDEQTSLTYGQVKARLKALGRPIPANDIWIAATAMQHGLTLLTRDSHFEVVEGLARERW